MKLKLCNFGLAETPPKGSKTIALVSKPKGTQLPPEVAASWKASGASDVYGLGVILWELYTSKLSSE